MKTLFLVFAVIFSGVCFCQESQKEQLEHLINDSKVFFKTSKGEIERISENDTSYVSKVSLNNEQNGSITYRSGKVQWAAYSVYLLESVSLTDAKKEALYWRELLQSVAPDYTEEVKNGSVRNVHGNPQYEYVFSKIEGDRKSWINVLYAKDKKTYYVYLSLGWQDWL